MTDQIDDWKLALRAAGKSRHTVRLYALAARKLAASEAGKAGGWGDVPARRIRAFLAALEDSGASAAHVQGMFYALKSFFAYLEDEEGIPSPMARMKGRRVPARPVPVLEPDQLAALVEACRRQQDPFLRVRDEAILRLLMDTGLRLAEITGLSVSGVALPLLTVTGKGDKTRTVAAGSRTQLALRRYLRARQRHPRAASEALWLGQHGPMSSSGIYKVVRTAGFRAGLDVHPHMLRHAWAHEFRASGGQLDDLVVLAGWSGPAMALRYGASAATRRALASASQRSLGDRI